MSLPTSLSIFPSIRVFSKRERSIRVFSNEGKIEGGRRRGQQRLDGITDSMDMSLSKLPELVRKGKPGVLQSMVSKESDTTEQFY